MDQILSYKCPGCGHTTLEEIRTNAQVRATIGEIVQYGENSVETDYSAEETTDSGYTDRYQCAKCGTIVINNDGRKIDFVDDLMDGAGITVSKTAQGETDV